MAQTGDTPAKGDVGTKPHFPLNIIRSKKKKEPNNNRNKVTQKYCLPPQQALQEEYPSVSRALEVLTNKRWEIIVTFYLTSAGTNVQGQLANRNVDWVETRNTGGFIPPKSHLVHLEGQWNSELDGKPKKQLMRTMWWEYWGKLIPLAQKFLGKNEVSFQLVTLGEFFFPANLRFINDKTQHFQ